MSEQGQTVVFILVEDELIGMIALADIIRESAKEAIATLHENNVHTIMLTGDNEKVDNWVAKKLGIDEVYDEVLPDHIAVIVKEDIVRCLIVAIYGIGLIDTNELTITI